MTNTAPAIDIDPDVNTNMTINLNGHTVSVPTRYIQLGYTKGGKLSAWGKDEHHERPYLIWEQGDNEPDN